MRETPTVFIIDDDPGVLRSLCAVLASQGLSTECYSSATDFLQDVDPRRRGCLVLDLRLPGLSGLDLLRKMNEEGTLRPTVMISGYADVGVAVDAMKLGAREFLEKPVSPKKLLHAVREALAAEDRAWGRRAAHHEARSKLLTLSRDEETVLRGIAGGLTNQQIADEMKVSVRTVQFRRASLMKKLGAASKSELIALLERANWLAR